jgi:hypothetical protein
MKEIRNPIKRIKSNKLNELKRQQDKLRKREREIGRERERLESERKKRNLWPAPLGTRESWCHGVGGFAVLFEGGVTALRGQGILRGRRRRMDSRMLPATRKLGRTSV